MYCRESGKLYCHSFWSQNVVGKGRKLLQHRLKMNHERAEAITKSVQIARQHADGANVTQIENPEAFAPQGDYLFA